MQRLTKYGLIFLAFSLLLGIILLFPAILLKLVVEPIATVLWAAWRVVASVDQDVYWLMLIVGYLVLTIRFLPRQARRSASPAYSHRHAPRTVVERWAAMLQDAHVGDEEAAILRGSLMNLLASAVSPDRPLSPAELQQALASRSISLSPAATSYLFAPAAKIRSPLAGYRDSIASWTPRWFQRWLHRTRGSDDTTIEELLQHMESIMEITHDTGQNTTPDR